MLWRRRLRQHSAVSLLNLWRAPCILYCQIDKPDTEISFYILSQLWSFIAVDIVMEEESVVESSTDNSSIDITDNTSDLSDLSSAQYQGLALLQKLQQLKVRRSLYYIDIINIQDQWNPVI